MIFGYPNIILVPLANFIQRCNAESNNKLFHYQNFGAFSDSFNKFSQFHLRLHQLLIIYLAAAANYHRLKFMIIRHQLTLQPFINAHVKQNSLIVIALQRVIF